ncbi:p21-activated protein kinase-interacting protein 1-like [Hetaerina americana]|uniref:p21-activated protein kinase-interacting protein 1-like n=1 Tax=Hetaerina americana TaxID=62018 RepID=UPI003A7F12A6
MGTKVNYVSDIEIILGTYEEFLLGYKISKLEDKNYSLANSFANHSHQASVRCCASSGQFLASGGADETIHLYDMVSRKEHGSLVQQNGTITCLAFHGQTHMFSASEDGTLCVWRVGSWQCEKILKGHRGAITSMSIHPSGKLALSVGRDRTLRTWNLVKGRSAYVTNLASVKGNKYGVDTGAEDVKWCPDGVHYAVIYRTKIDVYDLNIAGIVYTVDLGDHRVVCTSFISDEVMAVGTEAGVIEFHSVDLKKKVVEWKAYEEDERVRCISSVGLQTEKKLLMVTSSSTGLIKLWKLKQGRLDAEPKCIGEVNASCRTTCLTICVPKTGMKRKKGKNENFNEVKIEDDEVQEEDASRGDEILFERTVKGSTKTDSVSEGKLSEVQAPKKKRKMKGK